MSKVENMSKFKIPKGAVLKNAEKRRKENIREVTSAKEIVQILGGEKKSPGQYMALCPAHNDRNPSLAISQNGDKILLHCFAGCEYSEIKQALESKGISLGGNKEFTKSFGLPNGIYPTFNQKRYVAHWAYKNKSGEVLGYVVRYESGAGEKDIIPYFAKEKGKWKLGYPEELKNNGTRPLYNLDKISQIEPGKERIWIVEGEKVADALISLGLVATTSPGGSQAPKKTDWSPLADHSITIWPDNDRAGKTYSANVFRMILESGDTKESDLDIDTVDIEKLELKEKEDAYDWIYKKGYGEEDILSIPTTSIVDVSDIGVIEYEPSQTYKAIDQAEKLLLQVDPYSIFQRASKIYRITKSWQKGVEGDEQESIGTTQVTKGYLLDLLNRKLNFVQMTKDGYKPIDPPAKIAGRYLERSGEWNLHVLSGLTYAPTLKPDGTVLERPGYDESSGIYINTAGRKFKPVKKDPNKENAENALERLRNPFKEFPFVNPEDESVVLAAVLTALVRQSIPTAPLFGFTAPVAGSGKTLLADIISIIATGKQAVPTSQGDDKEEERKRLFAKLLQGKPVLLLDNIERALSSDTLCAILTAPGETYSDRILKQSEMFEVPTNSTFLATGNNITFLGDMTRRALLCTIDPKVENPESRENFTIKHLQNHVHRYRARYVQSALTILKAFIREGKPKQNIPQYGSFEVWSDWIRSSLVWLGCADPNLTRKKIEQEDPAKANLTRIIELWLDIYGDNEPVRVSEIIQDCNKAIENKNHGSKEFELAQAFLDVTRTKNKLLNGSSVGYWLRSNRDKYQNGFKIIKNPHSPKGAGVEWILTS